MITCASSFANISLGRPLASSIANISFDRPLRAAPACASSTGHGLPTPVGGGVGGGGQCAAAGAVDAG